MSKISLKETNSILIKNNFKCFFFFCFFCTERGDEYLQCNEQAIVHVGRMGEAHTAFYVVTIGGSSDVAQSWLERIIDSSIFTPFGRVYRWDSFADGDNSAQSIGTTGRSRCNFRSCPFRIGSKDARHGNGQNGIGLSAFDNIVQSGSTRSQICPGSGIIAGKSLCRAWRIHEDRETRRTRKICQITSSFTLVKIDRS